MLTEANEYRFSISANEPRWAILAIASASVSIVMCFNYKIVFFKNEDRFGFKIYLKILC